MTPTRLLRDTIKTMRNAIDQFDRRGTVAIVYLVADFEEHVKAYDAMQRERRARKNRRRG